MTIIVGIEHNDSIYIGGDRAIASEDVILSSDMPKVSIRNSYIYGYAGTIGIGQLMDIISLPAPQGNVFKTIKTKIVPALEVAIENYSRLHADHDTSWLIGCQGELYEVCAADWSVTRIKENAIGGGSPYALGSLYTSRGLLPIDRVSASLNAAITYSPTCQGPIDILSI